MPHLFHRFSKKKNNVKEKRDGKAKYKKRITLGLSLSCVCNSRSVCIFSACLLQFNTDSDCQAVYNECMSGKEVGGQQVLAQLLEGEFTS